MTQCSALASALNTKGYTSTKLAEVSGVSQPRVDGILAGNVKPTQQEFNSIARVLGLPDNPSHAAKVVVV